MSLYNLVRDVLWIPDAIFGNYPTRRSVISERESVSNKRVQELLDPQILVGKNELDKLKQRLAMARGALSNLIEHGICPPTVYRDMAEKALKELDE